jgi:hypothetical protein
VAHIGIAGFTLPSDVGWLSRQRVLMCENLICAGVALSVGSGASCPADSKPDLLWAPHVSGRHDSYAGHDAVWTRVA